MVGTSGRRGHGPHLPESASAILPPSLLYQEEKANGEDSTFFKLVSR